MESRVVVVTGASSGIGKATAECFAKAGYRVAVLARRKELLDELVQSLQKEAPEAKAKAYTCDITQWEQVAATFESIGRDFQKVNVLINNAGAFEYAPLEKSTPKNLDHMIDVNVRGMVYVTKACLSLLGEARKNNEWAKIINVSSISGLWGFSNMSVYTSTKFAVAGFSSGLRRELKAKGIQVGTIFPGPVYNKPGPRPNGKSRKLLMMPPEAADQVLKLAESRKHNLVSHPAFSMLHLIEPLSPSVVDSLLKRII